jgi:general secretion pathway protein B
MSFILDALKKSETDRQRQASPALFEVKVAAPRRKLPLWAVGLAVLLGVNVLALAWVLLRKSDATPTTQAATTAAKAAADAPAAAGTSQPGMVTVQIPVGTASSVTVGPNAPATDVLAPAGTAPLADEPLLEGREPAVPPDYDARDYRPAMTPEQAGAIAAARRSGSLPSRDEVLAQGNQLPDLRLDLHVYDANPVNRFVFINMRKLKEGEALPDGVRVDQITPRGAELSYRGTRFTIDGN